MSEQGVPMDEVTAKDFIMVRAALVKRLGGANEALVWARVFYRCDEDSRVAHDTDSGRWWAATHAVVGEETGLTAKQARSALESLVAAGYLVREQHSLRNNYDQTYSYQPIVLPGHVDVPPRADKGAVEGNSGLPSGADAPSTETREEVLENVRPPKPSTVGQRFALPLCEVLVAQMASNGAKVPDEISKRWLDDARLLVDKDHRDPHEAKALIEWATNDSFWRPNILSMPTFREKYDQLRLQAARKKPTTVGAGRDADAILRERARQPKAIAS